MTLTTTEELRGATRDAREAVLKIVNEKAEVPVKDVYARLVADEGRREPAIRTAIWDLISERQLIVRRGNILVIPGR